MNRTKREKEKIGTIHSHEWKQWDNCNVFMNFPAQPVENLEIQAAFVYIIRGQILRTVRISVAEETGTQPLLLEKRKRNTKRWSDQMGLRVRYGVISMPGDKVVPNPRQPESGVSGNAVFHLTY